MNCPNCASELNETYNYCDSCGLFAPWGEIFADENSFREWRKLIRPKVNPQSYSESAQSYQPRVHDKFSYELRKARLDFIEKYSNTNIGSAINPLQLKCSAKHLKTGYTWAEVKLPNKLPVRLVLKPNTAEFDTLMEFGNDGNLYYCVLKDLNPNKTIPVKTINVVNSDGIAVEVKPIVLTCSEKHVQTGYTWDRVKLDDGSFVRLVLRPKTGTIGSVMEFDDGRRKHYCILSNVKDVANNKKDSNDIFSMYNLDYSRVKGPFILRKVDNKINKPN